MNELHPDVPGRQAQPAFERAEAETRRALAGLLREAADAYEADDIDRLVAVMNSFHARDAHWRRQRTMLENRRAAEMPAVLLLKLSA